jgi:hypothetical protein
MLISIHPAVEEETTVGVYLLIHLVSIFIDYYFPILIPVFMSILSVFAQR